MHKWLLCGGSWHRERLCGLNPEDWLHAVLEPCERMQMLSPAPSYLILRHSVVQPTSVASWTWRWLWEHKSDSALQGFLALCHDLLLLVSKKTEWGWKLWAPSSLNGACSSPPHPPASSLPAFIWIVFTFSEFPCGVYWTLVWKVWEDFFPITSDFCRIWPSFICQMSKWEFAKRDSGSFAFSQSAGATFKWSYWLMSVVEFILMVPTLPSLVCLSLIVQFIKYSQRARAQQWSTECKGQKWNLGTSGPLTPKGQTCIWDLMSFGLSTVGGIITKWVHFFLESPLGRSCGYSPVVHLAPFRISEVEILLLGRYVIGWENVIKVMDMR